MKTILASGSPRRKDLLSQIGIDYEVIVSNADENVQESNPAKYVEALSYKKAEAVALENRGRVVIGADTVVSIDGKILGKPGSSKQAEEMLRMLSGRSHEVYTGVTILNIPEEGSGEKGISHTFFECTKVFFYEMSETEIAAYIETGDPFDKAGSYGIQGFCARYIKGIEGDYNNVVGLPAGRLYQELKMLGLV